MRCLVEQFVAENGLVRTGQAEKDVPLELCNRVHGGNIGIVENKRKLP